MKKRRLDEILIERGLVKDKNEAFVRVTEGFVFVDGQKAVSPAQTFDPAVLIKVRQVLPYVGRGGLKLAEAFKRFSFEVREKTCADIGAATGGFTDVLLQNGAAKVYAIDTGWGKLHPKLRSNPKVVVMEKTNILYLESLPKPIERAVADLSFTSLRLLLPALKKFLVPDAEGVFLFKPQYEVDQADIHHGIVEDKEVRERVLQAFLAWAADEEWEVKETAESPIRGAKGNVEYLVHLQYRK